MNKKAKDPIDKLIFEKGLRIKHVWIDRSLDLLLIILNNGNVLKASISSFARLKPASEKQLNNWKLIGKGVGISWEELDEDLSLKGFINTTALDQTLKSLTGKSKIII